MPEELLTVIRIPIQEIETSVRSKYFLPKVFVDAKIDNGALLLYFGNSKKFSENVVAAAERVEPKKSTRTRRQKRIRTKGWKVLTWIINSKGKKVPIYKPFVDALNGKTLTLDEQRIIVERIMEANGNLPTSKSVAYFLENTLEYLQSQRTRALDGFVDPSLANAQETKTA